MLSLIIFFYIASTVAVSFVGWTMLTSLEQAMADEAAPPYDRKLYKHWIDEDRDCQDTRQEVLIAESRSPVALDEDGCRVVSGYWICPYTGLTFKEPSRLDIDHWIPLAEVHESGGAAWSPEQRRAYANDLTHPYTLVAVWRSANRSKGKKDPAHWLPAERSCTYAVQWLALKSYWALSMDRAEDQAIREKLASCYPVRYIEPLTR